MPNSELEQNLLDLSDDQFQQAQAAFAAAKSARGGGDPETRRKVANMTAREFEKYRDENMG